ncbi:MBL fold metallo-hydrolase [Pseudonocardia acidicola]|uniref:MBL fold metallo-hydrolase n=1 Tax=Pseudonocardia acidicola TaxID=2724939 RepID=A0ABX1SAN1_9PSEU|nr:MBL fold metallo-hydrolase [Pseudonocardia acidicola]NMH97922.1 MBL fold metallo-hydrolase [Pseudonocardia acidicola]
MLPRIDRLVTSGTVTINDEPQTVENNVWLLGDDTDVLVIDAGHDAEAIREAIGDRRLFGIACTHGHRNHVDQAPAVADSVGGPTLLNAADQPIWDEIHPNHGPDGELPHDEILRVAHVEVRVLHTPGHSPGSVCLYVPALRTVFTGDTLFKGGIGRTDLRLSHFPTIINSLRERVLALPPQTRVLPGHGDETTVADEIDNVELWAARGS